MLNLKDYRDKELRYYIIANISVLLLLLDYFHIPSDDTTLQIVPVISNVLNSLLISAAVFTFTFVTDSLFPSKLKEKLVCFRQPGERIFTEIKTKNKDKRFTPAMVSKVYAQIYNNMPKEKKDMYSYENSEWYKIYNKYREVPMIAISNRDFLLCRDIYFSTISTILLYLILTFLLKVIGFDCRYIIYLIIMLVISNFGTRNMAKRFVDNVIAYDVANYK